MKLRMNGNSLRLRLGQSEVQRLATYGILEESTPFGPSDEHRFTYAICHASESTTVTAAFSNGRIVIYVPASQIHRWATTDQISIRAIQLTGDDRELRILVEKDFECIDAPSAESQKDAFPNLKLADSCQHAPPQLP